MTPDRTLNDRSLNNSALKHTDKIFAASRIEPPKLLERAKTQDRTPAPRYDSVSRN